MHYMLTTIYGMQSMSNLGSRSTSPGSLKGVKLALNIFLWRARYCEEYVLMHWTGFRRDVPCLKQMVVFAAVRILFWKRQVVCSSYPLWVVLADWHMLSEYCKSYTHLPVDMKSQKRDLCSRSRSNASIVRDLARWLDWLGRSGDGIEKLVATRQILLFSKTHTLQTDPSLCVTKTRPMQRLGTFNPIST